MLPETSPVNKAIAATQKAIEHERQVFKRVAPGRVQAAIDALEKVNDLVVYNPTEQQCLAILKTLRDEITRIEASFKTIAPRQISFNLE